MLGFNEDGIKFKKNIFKWEKTVDFVVIIIFTYRRVGFVGPQTLRNLKNTLVVIHCVIYYIK